MALTLTLADNADTPTGFGRPRINVRLAHVRLLHPGGPPVAGGCVGSWRQSHGYGFLAVSVPPRFYFVYAVTSVGEVTPPERIAVTTWEESVAERVQAAVVARLKLADLPRVGDGVHNQILLDATPVKFPCVVVYLENLSEGEERSTNGTDDIVYPMSIILLDTG